MIYKTLHRNQQTEKHRKMTMNRKMTMIYKTLHRNQQTEKHEQENDNDLQNTTQKSTD